MSAITDQLVPPNRDQNESNPSQISFKKRKVKHTNDEVRDEISRLEDILFRKSSAKADVEEISEDDRRSVSPPPAKKAAAWEDDEDLHLTVDQVVSDVRIDHVVRKTALPESATSDRYSKMLEEKFKAVVGTPKWAVLQEQTDDNDFAAKVLRNSTKLFGSSGTLATTTLNYTKLADMNEKGILRQTVITAIDFNPMAQMSAVANRSGNVSFYQVDGDKNSLLHKAAFKNYPISAAKFSTDGRELLIGSEHKTSMQCFDLNTNKATDIPAPLKGPEISSTELFCLSGNGEYVALAGKDGTIAILTSSTKELIHTVKMGSKCNALNFSTDSSKLFSYGTDGKVYVWDVKQRKCLHRFVDEGCLGGLTMSLSAGDQYLALGSTSGVVNIYEKDSFFPKGSELSMYPQPAKAIMNLTTAADFVHFNPSAQILAIASKLQHKALKLMHLPSMTVFKNFPERSLELGRVNHVAFSPNSGYMAVGTNIGMAKLIRLHHFSNY
ncbi:U3 small nucleolar RNA-associated protein 18 homolog [Neocloeon triangulifer]|uniref:U3 small nucleolar RNA-associated protein 18 homolog n=1 Tax=Neocloeon triangulifer TaxID=2078957 RepID=UPI00286FAC4F|nr:U3 small nucleolar RNA-associated protein 18 homolog [Neocloeon triangulifer]